MSNIQEQRDGGSDWPSKKKKEKNENDSDNDSHRQGDRTPEQKPQAPFKFEFPFFNFQGQGEDIGSYSFSQKQEEQKDDGSDNGSDRQIDRTPDQKLEAETLFKFEFPFFKNDEHSKTSTVAQSDQKHEQKQDHPFTFEFPFFQKNDLGQKDTSRNDEQPEEKQQPPQEIVTSPIGKSDASITSLLSFELLERPGTDLKLQQGDNGIETSSKQIHDTASEQHSHIQTSQSDHSHQGRDMPSHIIALEQRETDSMTSSHVQNGNNSNQASSKQVHDTTSEQYSNLQMSQSDHPDQGVDISSHSIALGSTEIDSMTSLHVQNEDMSNQVSSQQNHNTASGQHSHLQISQSEDPSQGEDESSDLICRWGTASITLPHTDDSQIIATETGMGSSELVTQKAEKMQNIPVNSTQRQSMNSHCMPCERSIPKHPWRKPPTKLETVKNKLLDSFGFSTSIGATDNNNSINAFNDSEIFLAQRGLMLYDDMNKTKENIFTNPDYSTGKPSPETTPITSLSKTERDSDLQFLNQLHYDSDKSIDINADDNVPTEEGDQSIWSFLNFFAFSLAKVVSKPKDIPTEIDKSEDESQQSSSKSSIAKSTERRRSFNLSIFSVEHVKNILDVKYHHKNPSFNSFGNQESDEVESLNSISGIYDFSDEEEATRFDKINKRLTSLWLKYQNLLPMLFIFFGLLAFGITLAVL